ncbi:ankyrin repeat-containing domain protein [Durotheca rogersii]|uniref:ankyrin repeat-containing domain protein n=1 Tax=Durotheca rogersii TaxID=419775 RepID=UPI00221F73FE|nr:ankyrin repeat-containing domain protein [Durotheca rogersii]KAI5868692.1 ankyrin repeat-containing domain protein [Durotheca rogersii]
MQSTEQKRAPGLLDLPLDIFPCVAENLTDRSLANFCLSCRAICEALNSALYRRARNNARVLTWAIKKNHPVVVRKLLEEGTNPDLMLGPTPSRGNLFGGSFSMDFTDYLPSPSDRPELEVRVGQTHQPLSKVLPATTGSKKPKPHIDALASVFKVVNDARRGIVGNALDVYPMPTPYLAQNRGMISRPSQYFASLGIWTPLHLAAGRGRRQIVEILLENGANIDALSRGFDTYRFSSRRIPEVECSWWKPLFMAIYQRDYDLVKLLVESGASFFVGTEASGRPDGHVTALHVSCSTGSIDISSFLVDHYGPEMIHIKDHRGMTPLSWAYREGKWDMIYWLVRQGASVETQAGNGRSLLLDACARWDFDSALRILRLDENPSYLSVASSLHYICGKPAPPVGEDLGVYRGRYYDECHEDRFQVADALIEKRADVNARTIGGNETPLALAATHHLVSIVKLLIAAGADIDAQDNAGNTPLMRACRRNPETFTSPIPTVKLLLKQGASPAKVNHVNQTALDIACSSDGPHSSEIVQLLKQHATSNHPETLGGI